MEQTKERIDAMARICAGMTLEEMQNAAFTYQSLVEIVQRRDVRVPLSALVLPKKGTDEDANVVVGYNLALDHVQRRIDELMGERK